MSPGKCLSSDKILSRDARRASGRVSPNCHLRRCSASTILVIGKVYFMAFFHALGIDHKDHSYYGRLIVRDVICVRSKSSITVSFTCSYGNPHHMPYASSRCRSQMLHRVAASKGAHTEYQCQSNCTCDCGVL